MPLISSRRKNTALIAFVSALGGAFLSLFLFMRPDVNPVTPVAAAPNQGEIAAVENFQNVFRKVAAEALPWVVEVDIVEVRETVRGGFPWDRFFNNSPEEEDSTKEYRTPGKGSGFIVEKKGGDYFIVTNNHVAGAADEILIILDNGDEYEASLVGTDPRMDLALLKVSTKDNLPVAVLGDSDQLYVGDWVLAIGSPYGYKSSVSAGIISALGRQQGPEGNISDFIQTDAAINQGNSGGPLVNLKGEVVGINTWITTSTGGSIGLGFSIPINNAKKTIGDLIRDGKTEYGWLGVSIGPLGEDLQEDLGIKEKGGAMVFQVFTKSPADRSGIRAGDYIIAVNDEKAQNANHLTRMIGDMRPNERARFLLLRDGKELTLTVTIEERGSEEEIQEMNSQAWPGVSLYPLTEALADRLGLEELKGGVYVRDVYPKTSLQVAGIQRGDIITGINKEKINSVREFFNVIGAVGNDKFYVSFQRDGYEMETPRISKK